MAQHSLSPAELVQIRAAERAGDPFLTFRGGDERLRLHPLAGAHEISLGRSPHNDVALSWDREVSRTHAQLALLGGEWTVSDDGLSRNGSFVNGERLAGRRRLQDGDVIKIGVTTIVFRDPAVAGESTAVASANAPVTLTPAERRVLVALCRPLVAPAAGDAIPASNRAIADELHLSLDGVKFHIRSLFAKLAVDDIPQYGKRTALAQRAVATGIVTARDLSKL